MSVYIIIKSGPWILTLRDSPIVKTLHYFPTSFLNLAFQGYWRSNLMTLLDPPPFEFLSVTWVLLTHPLKETNFYSNCSYFTVTRACRAGTAPTIFTITSTTYCYSGMLPLLILAIATSAASNWREGHKNPSQENSKLTRTYFFSQRKTFLNRPVRC